MWRVNVTACAWMLACLIAVPGSNLAGQEPAGVNVPLVGKDGGSGLTAAPTTGVEVSAQMFKEKPPGTRTTVLRFGNSHSERRLAALEGVPEGTIEGARVLAFEYSVEMQQGEDGRPWIGVTPPIVALFFEKDGGVWYRIRNGYDHEKVRVPLRGAFERAAFATDDDDSIRWEQVERIWLGLLIDRPGSGFLLMSEPRFTDEAFRPNSPAYVNRGRFRDVAQDPAVRGKLTLPDFTTTEYRFEMPGGRHMYAMFRIPVEVDELDAYSALQFTYQADLPQGIDGLLVMLIERDGTQYRAIPAPAENADWNTVTLPFSQFVLGSWSKDENDRLDLEQVNLVAIGIHGTTPSAASGVIRVREMQFVP
jgi:hypothetical protein